MTAIPTASLLHFMSCTPMTMAPTISPSTRMTSNPKRSGRCSRCSGTSFLWWVASTGAATSASTATAHSR